MQHSFMTIKLPFNVNIFFMIYVKNIIQKGSFTVVDKDREKVYDSELGRFNLKSL